MPSELIRDQVREIKFRALKGLDPIRAALEQRARKIGSTENWRLDADQSATMNALDIPNEGRDIYDRERRIVERKKELGL